MKRAIKEISGLIKLLYRITKNHFREDPAVYLFFSGKKDMPEFTTINIDGLEHNGRLVADQYEAVIILMSAKIEDIKRLQKGQDIENTYTKSREK